MKMQTKKPLTADEKERAIRAKPLSKRALSRLIPLTKVDDAWHVDMNALITQELNHAFTTDNKRLAQRIAQAAREWVLSHSLRSQHDLFCRWSWLIETGIIDNVKRSDLVRVR